MGIRTHRGGDVAEARPFVFVDKRCGPGGGGAGDPCHAGDVAAVR